MLPLITNVKRQQVKNSHKNVSSQKEREGGRERDGEGADSTPRSLGVCDTWWKDESEGNERYRAIVVGAKVRYKSEYKCEQNGLSD